MKKFKLCPQKILKKNQVFFYFRIKIFFFHFCIFFSDRLECWQNLTVFPFLNSESRFKTCFFFKRQNSKNQVLKFDSRIGQFFRAKLKDKSAGLQTGFFSKIKGFFCQKNNSFLCLTYGKILWFLIFFVVDLLVHFFGKKNFLLKIQKKSSISFQEIVLDFPFTFFCVPSKMPKAIVDLQNFNFLIFFLDFFWVSKDKKRVTG